MPPRQKNKLQGEEKKYPFPPKTLLDFAFVKAMEVQASEINASWAERLGDARPSDGRPEPGDVLLLKGEMQKGGHQYAEAEKTLYARRFFKKMNLDWPDNAVFNGDQREFLNSVIASLMDQATKWKGVSVISDAAGIGDVWAIYVRDLIPVVLTEYANNLADPFRRAEFFTDVLPLALRSREPVVFDEFIGLAKRLGIELKPSADILAQCFSSGRDPAVFGDHFSLANIVAPAVDVRERKTFLQELVAYAPYERIKNLLATLSKQDRLSWLNDILDLDLFEVIAERNDPAILRLFLKQLSREDRGKWAKRYLDHHLYKDKGLLNESAMLREFMPYLKANDLERAKKKITNAYQVSGSRELKKRFISFLRFLPRLLVYPFVIGISAILYLYISRQKRIVRSGDTLGRARYSDPNYLSGVRYHIRDLAGNLGYRSVHPVSLSVRGATLDAMKVMRSQINESAGEQKWVVYFTRLGERMPTELHRNLDYFAEQYPGSNILACDFRYFGEHASKIPLLWSKNALIDDQEGAIYHLLNRGVKAENIEIVSDCLGAAVGAATADRLHRQGHKVYLTSVRSPGSFSGHIFSSKIPKLILRGLMYLTGAEINASKFYRGLPETHRKHVAVDSDTTGIMRDRLVKHERRQGDKGSPALQAELGRSVVYQSNDSVSKEEDPHCARFSDLKAPAVSGDRVPTANNFSSFFNQRGREGRGRESDKSSCSGSPSPSPGSRL